MVNLGELMDEPTWKTATIMQCGVIVRTHAITGPDSVKTFPLNEAPTFINITDVSGHTYRYIGSGLLICIT